MRIHDRSNHRAAGFSLIEAMIAVFVLAVGLLALVALQTNLVREGADAKARSRIASLVSSRLDEARAGGYFSIAGKDATGCVGGNDICLAETDAAVSGLSLTQTVAATAGANNSQFKTMTVAATWTDSAARARSLSMSTIISPLSLDTSSTLLNQQFSGDSAKTPIVRTADPATDGVVPIALGNGSASAASNPTPELVGKDKNQEVVGTRFNVLTYVPSGSSSVIQRRTETTVIKCTCSFSADYSAVPVIFHPAQSQWPAVWTGERYEIFKPSTTIAAPGTALSAGPAAGVEQSPLCLECCRDHHESADTGVAKFDPERVDGSGKFDLVTTDGVTKLVGSPSGTYVDACRVVRVDGMWRTAADTYARQLGLLETEPLNDVKAKTGLPTDSATTAYTAFVKSYLKQYDGTTGAAPNNAEALFNVAADGATASLNDPAVVPVAAPSTSDFRYMHSRGLYVDYLEEAARKKITAVLADTGPNGLCPTGSSLEDCVMPFLPFTSANLTEIAKWTASDADVLVVNSGNLLATNSSEPSGGRTLGTKVGAADNTVTTRMSNSGIAVNTILATLGGVDPADDTAELTDAQAFEVGGTPDQTTGDEFFVTIAGGGANPFVHYVLGTDTGECVMRSDGTRPCATNSTLPLAGSVRLERYWRETTTNLDLGGTCDSGGGVLVSVKGKADVPTFTNFAVTAASIGGTNGTIGTAVNDGKVTETTTVSFASIPAAAVVALRLTAQGSVTYATPTTCTVGNGGNTTITGWSKPWEQP